MTNKKVILSYLPPATIYYPSPALSILKSFLEQHNYTVEIKYWNFLLNSIITKTIDEEITEIESKLMPFYAAIADIYKDKEAKNKIFAYIHKTKPSYIIEGLEKFSEYFNEIKQEVYNILNTELNKIDFNNVLVFGISYKLLQLIPGVILAGLIKEKQPEIKIVIGGIGNKEIAIEVMEICPDFDFAIWGEGEYPLLELAEQLKENKKDFKNISRLIYRENNNIQESKAARSKYLDFQNYILPEYSEYIILKEQIEKKEYIYCPINSIRSCHWKKCNFCDYNSGYKYRERTPQSIVDEIDYMINAYGIRNFMFVDNDVVGTSIERFKQLLICIIDYKKRTNNKFYLWCEMIPHKDLNEEIIKYMYQAGFLEIFIGYEAITDTLLKKMNKSNDFAMNLFMVKSTLRNNIKIRTNLIKAIPDETKEDVLESINNLHYLRFFFHIYMHKLSHHKGNFTLHKDTGYYKRLNADNIKNYNTNPYSYYLPKKFLKQNTSLFGYYKGFTDNQNEWFAFNEAEQFYKENEFNYYFKSTKKGLVYKEYLNDKEIKSHLFNDQEYIDTLIFTNDSVCSFETLYNKISLKNKEIKKERVIEILSHLKSEYLLYYNSNMTRIVSIVDINREKITCKSLNLE